ncbi:hypothetical protein [Kitasatospora sp. NPDC059599]
MGGPWESFTARKRAMVEHLRPRTARRDPWGDTVEDEDPALAELLRRGA